MSEKQGYDCSLDDTVDCRGEGAVGEEGGGELGVGDGWEWMDRVGRDGWVKNGKAGEKERERFRGPGDRRSGRGLWEGGWRGRGRGRGSESWGAGRRGGGREGER